MSSLWTATGKIIDALKRVDASMSSERLVLPGIPYRLPPPQKKLCLLTASREEIVERVCSMPGGTGLSKALLSSLQGVSPVVCRELQHRTGRGIDLRIAEMTPELRERLSFFVGRLAETVESVSGTPYLAVGPDQKAARFFISNRSSSTEPLPSSAGKKVFPNCWTIFTGRGIGLTACTSVPRICFMFSRPLPNV